MAIIDSEAHVKNAICQYLNDNIQGDFPTFEATSIIALDVVGDNIRVLINCGIKGIPRFTIPADKLEFNPKPIVSRKEEIEEAKPKPVTNGRRKRGSK